MVLRGKCGVLACRQFVVDEEMAYNMLRWFSLLEKISTSFWYQRIYHFLLLLPILHNAWSGALAELE